MIFDEVCDVADKLAGVLRERERGLRLHAGEFIEDAPEIPRRRLDIVVSQEARGPFAELLIGSLSDIGEGHGRAEVDVCVELEEPSDHAVEVWSDRLGAGEQCAVCVARIQDSTDVLWEVAVIGSAVCSGNRVLFDELILVEDLENVFCGPDPDLFAAVGVGDVVDFALILDVPVGVNGGLFPRRDVKRRCRQRI